MTGGRGCLRKVVLGWLMTHFFIVTSIAIHVFQVFSNPPTLTPIHNLHSPISTPRPPSVSSSTPLVYPVSCKGRICGRVRSLGRLRQHRGRPAMRHHLWRLAQQHLRQLEGGSHRGTEHHRAARAQARRGRILSVRSLDEAGFHHRGRRVRVHAGG